MRTWVRLARVYGRMIRVLETQVREHGLTLAQFDVLTHVARSEGLNQQELAAELLVTKGNVSHLVNRLARAGLLERRSVRGRACYLYPTAAGRQLLEEIISPHNALLAAMFEPLPLERLVALHTMLRDLDHALS